MALSQNSFAIRKFNVKRKTEKKKPAQELFKPEIALKYEQYTNFLSYINISNNLKVSCESFDNPYVLFVGKGNNGSLIRNIFRTYRPWWTIEENDP